MDKNFTSEAEKLISEIRAKTNNEDVFVFHSTLDIHNPHFQIDNTDAKIIYNFLQNPSSNPKDKTLNLLIQTRGGLYDSALHIHKLLRSEYKIIKTIINHFAMSCGTALSMLSDELFLHQNCSLGAFDPQLQFSSSYPPIGLYSVLKMVNIHNQSAPLNPTLASSTHPNLVSAHTDYHSIKDYLKNEFTKSPLLSGVNLQNIFDRFYQDDHKDYNHHGHTIDFNEFRNYVPNAKPLAFHAAPAELTNLFLLCENLLNQYPLSRVYIHNSTFHFR